MFGIAHNTSITPILQSIKPILIGVFSWKSTLFSPSKLYRNIALWVKRVLSIANANNIPAITPIFRTGFSPNHFPIGGIVPKGSCFIDFRSQLPVNSFSLTVVFAVLNVLLTRLLVKFILVSFSIFSMCFKDYMFVIFVVSFSIQTGARFAAVLKTIFCGFVFIKFANWLNNFASGTTFCRGIHSVSLSLNLMLLSAGGEIDRLFGSYPSRHLHYITERV